MIDAYEIGIQLLLQDDVSAGLAVINRGLAEVDRAIAATSADLAGLTREAETATKSVAAAVGKRPNLAAASSPEAKEPDGPAIRSELEQGMAVTPAVATGAKSAAPEAEAAGKSVPASPVASEPGGKTTSLKQETREQTVAPRAPVRGAADEVVVSVGRVDTIAAAPESAPVSVAPMQALTKVPAPTESAVPPAARTAVMARQEPRRSVTPPNSPVALTASVNRAPRSEVAGAQPERARHRVSAETVARRERPAAPWSGVDHAGTQAETNRPQERAAAPQTPSRGQSESQGGSVMLDGRLVGQWLSEHMGREASRPPGGTSFFDPRQTPAWNVSGAL